uniref:Chromo domain-containing protein n=1 Tax=Panagrolaimus sp. ES5 TaxID=591445 RepID=A0AC34F1F2_9BILA
MDFIYQNHPRRICRTSRRFSPEPPKFPRRISRNSSSKSSSPEYDVEQILGKRRNGRNIEYLIKWKGYDSSQNSWEPKSYCNSKIKPPLPSFPSVQNSQEPSSSHDSPLLHQIPEYSPASPYPFYRIQPFRRTRSLNDILKPRYEFFQNVNVNPEPQAIFKKLRFGTVTIYHYEPESEEEEEEAVGFEKNVETVENESYDYEDC